MLPNFKKTIEFFECMNLDNNAYFVLKNSENIKVYLQYIKKNIEKSWSIWSDDKVEKIFFIANDFEHLISLFKLSENQILEEISNLLLFQAAFADEFIRQATELFGKEAIQKSIYDTQSFMEEIKKSVQSTLLPSKTLTKHRLKIIK